MQEIELERMEEGIKELHKRFKYAIQDFIDEPKGADIILSALSYTLYEVIYCVEGSERCRNSIVKRMQDWDFDE